MNHRVGWGTWLPAHLDPNSSKLSRLISRPLLSELCSWESVVSTVLYVPVDFRNKFISFTKTSHSCRGQGYLAIKSFMCITRKWRNPFRVNQACYYQQIIQIWSQYYRSSHYKWYTEYIWSTNLSITDLLPWYLFWWVQGWSFVQVLWIQQLTMLLAVERIFSPHKICFNQFIGKLNLSDWESIFSIVDIFCDW